MAGRYTDQHPQFSDSNGVPLADGEIEFFIVGTTGVGNRKNTFSDVGLTTPNPNPISLDGSGRSINPIFLDGTYNTIIRDTDLVQIDQVDNVSGPSSGEGVGSQTVNLVADLKPIDTATFKEIYVLGTTVIGDGGQGNFYFNATSVESDNGLNIIEPDVGGGRWLLQNNAHDSITTAQAAGTSDAITIATSPLSTALDSERVFFVENTLGPNTITGVTFRVDTTTLLTLKRDNSAALVVGDTGPVGYKMQVQLLDDDSAYILINPFKVTSDKIVDDAVTTAKINDLAVTTAKINNLAVTEGKIGALAVTEGKIGALAVTTAKIAAEAVTIAKLSWMPFSSKDGLEVSNGSVSATDIDISAGRIVDSTQSKILALSSVLTKEIDNPWVAGNGGGFPTGISIINGTWYRVFIIAKTDGTTDVGFDTSATATNLLADATGYTLFRRIGWALNVLSPDILNWSSSTGGEYVWDIATPSNPTTGTSAASTDAVAPPNQKTKVQVSLSDTNTHFLLITELSQTNSTPSITNKTLETSSGSTSSGSEITRNADSSSNIRYRSSSATGTFRLSFVSWIDDIELP